MEPLDVDDLIRVEFISEDELEDMLISDLSLEKLAETQLNTLPSDIADALLDNVSVSIPENRTFDVILELKEDVFAELTSAELVFDEPLPESVTLSIEEYDDITVSIEKTGILSHIPSPASTKLQRFCKAHWQENNTFLSSSLA